MSLIARLHSALEQLVRRLLRPARSSAALLAGMACDLTRSRSELVVENAILRQQLIVLRRSVHRPLIRGDDRLILVLLARVTLRWRTALHLVCPDTLLRWHRDLYKMFWRRQSRPRSRPKRLSPETIDLVRTMAMENVLWGAERIRGELLKLGVCVSKRTIQKYMREARPPGKRGQSWTTFIKNHGRDTWACDFLQLHDVLFRPIFALFFVVHGSREVVHVNVTRSPTNA